MPQPLGQGRTQRRDDQHASLGCGICPWLEELPLLLDAHCRAPATTPGRIQLGRVRQAPSHLGLAPTHRRTSDTQGSSRLLQCRPE